MTSRICILTDSTAQFPAPVFPGQELVSMIPLRVVWNHHIYADGKDIRATQLPLLARSPGGPAALPPTPEDFGQVFAALSRRFHEVIVILTSSHLCPVVGAAQEAAETFRSSATIHIIDSQTTAVGLGLLVQTAAEAALNNSSSAEINRLVRGLVPHVYTVFCVQSLSYLHHSGHLDPSQALVGEMLGVSPFFILESGRLVPIQKIRNSRHLVDTLHEFITEFASLKHIAIVQGTPPFEQEARSLRERLNGSYTTTAFSEHSMGAALATILGPRTLGVVTMENYDLA